MGNQNQGALNCGYVFVQTDKPVYYAGDQVTGCVYLHIVAPFPGNTVVLKIKGGEQVYWQEVQQIQEALPNPEPGQPTHKTIEKQHEHTGVTQFYQHKIILYQFYNMQFMPPGQYTFPFTFLLGKDLPGTYLEVNGEKYSNYKCLVRYQIKAECESLQEKVVKSIKHKQELVVREPLKNALKDLKSEMEAKPTLCCCFSQGKSKITCFFEKNFYLPGEQARMLAEVDNSQCSLPVTGINCTLQKNLTLKFKDGRTRSFTSNLNSFSFPGVPAKEKAIGEGARSLTLAMGDPTKPMSPTTNAKLVQCFYTILVVAQVDGCCLCCSPIPSVVAKVQIAPPPPPNYGTVQPPPNWYPMVFEVRNVSLTNEYMYKARKEGGGYLNQPPPPPPFQPYMAPPPQYNHPMYNPSSSSSSNNTSIDSVHVQINMPLVPPSQRYEQHVEERKEGSSYQPPHIEINFGGTVGVVKRFDCRLEMNQSLSSDEYLVSANQVYYARVQSDGNFVIYQSVEANFAPENAIWSSNTWGKGTGPFSLRVQQDGNLVLYDRDNKPTWASDTWNKGSAPYSLVMNMDGNLVLYGANNNSIWESGTSGK